jgi:hypothetical protein
MAFLSQNPTAAQQNHTGSSQMLVDSEKLGGLQSFQTSSMQIVWRLAGVLMQGVGVPTSKKIINLLQVHCIPHSRHAIPGRSNMESMGGCRRGSGCIVQLYSA